jgi:DNA-binding SARP family transcriptional activator
MSGEDHGQPVVPSAGVWVLRSFRLLSRGRTTRIPRSAERVLAFLALADRPQPRAVVAGRLWADLPERRAGATLRTTLWQIRRAAPGVASVRDGHLTLGPGVEVDLKESISSIRRLERTGEYSGDPAPSWYDDVLPDWPEEWVTVERERYRQLRLHALELLCRRLTTSGRLSTAIEVGLIAVAADPLRESAQRVLIEAHLAEGNLSEAARQYQSFARLLRSSLGLEPTTELQALLPWGRSLIKTAQ